MNPTATPPAPGARVVLDEAAIERALAVWPFLAAGEHERAMTALHTKDTK